MKKKVIFALVLGIGFHSSFVFAADSKPTSTGMFKLKNITVSGVTMPYVVYAPKGIKAMRDSPAVLFLHGSGERGTQNEHLNVGLPKVLAAHPELFEMVVVIPQAAPNTNWIRPVDESIEGSPRPLDLAFKALMETVHAYGSNRNKIFLTGLSLGGFGTWTLGSEHPDLFAAIMPICGGGDPATMAEPLKIMPTYVFHGSKDASVKVQRSREMVEALRDQQNPNVHYTEFSDEGHVIWDQVYEDQSVMNEFFSETRKAL